MSELYRPEVGDYVRAKESDGFRFIGRVREVRAGEVRILPVGGTFPTAALKYPGGWFPVGICEKVA